MAHILIVEDESKLAQVLLEYCQQAGFAAKVLSNGAEVEAHLQRHPVDLLVLDLMLPELDGLSVCKAIRQSAKSYANVPILMATAKVDEIDRLMGLELGADDYICKPYSPRQLNARIKAILRRSQPAPDAVLVGGPSLDLKTLTLAINDRVIELTLVEAQLLQKLMQNAAQVFSREQLMQDIYQDHRIVSERTIDSHIKKVRKKIARVDPQHDYIQSVYGAGYKFVLPA